MAEVVFFILGSLFAFVLSMAVLVTIAGLPLSSGQPVATTSPAARSATTRSAAARSSPGEPQPAAAQPLPSDRQLPGPDLLARSDREAYRIATALERAEVTLFRIARLGEPQAAKIAAQTLRRLKQGGESPKARLTFALSRLELLSLRPEVQARAMARDVLDAIA